MLRDVDPSTLTIFQRGYVGRLRDRGIVVGESMREHFTPFLIPIGGPLRQPGRGRGRQRRHGGRRLRRDGVGDLAARAVQTAPSDVSMLAARHRRACNYEIGAEPRDSVRIQRDLFADRRRIARVIDGAHRELAIARLIVDFVVGRRWYRDLRRRMLMRSPVLAGPMVWDQLTRKTLSPEPDLSRI